MAQVSSALPTASVTQNQFLQLMVKELQSQDPLSPSDNGQMLSQLAQFSTLAGMENLNSSFSDMLTLQQITQGSNLIGKKVTYTDTTGNPVTAAVSSVDISNGALALKVGSDSITLAQVTGIAS